MEGKRSASSLDWLEVKTLPLVTRGGGDYTSLRRRAPLTSKTQHSPRGEKKCIEGMGRRESHSECTVQGM